MRKGAWSVNFLISIVALIILAAVVLWFSFKLILPYVLDGLKNVFT